MSIPYFPMYPTDFEADTSHLTLAEDGAYNRLLRLMWMTPACSLPDDDQWIMRRMRVSKEDFDNIVLVVIEEFFVRSKGRLSNARLAMEFIKTHEAHSKRVLAGSKGGKAKSLKSKDSTPSKAKAMLKQPEPEPEPEPSSSQEVENYERYLKAHPKPVSGDAGLILFSELVCDGADPEQIISAARAYAETVKHWSEEGKVQQSDNFLDQDRGKWKSHVPKQIKTRSTDAEIEDWYASVVIQKKASASSSVNVEMAGRLLAVGKVTAEQLKAAGVAA